MASSVTCPICNRPLCQTAFGDSTDYEQRARCYKLGYERLRDEVNEYREAKEAAYERIYKLRDLLRRSLDVVSPYGTMLWQEIHRAVHLGEFSAPECPGPDCKACNGAACELCGAGCWSQVSTCEHDVVDRHRRPRVSGAAP